MKVRIDKLPDGWLLVMHGKRYSFKVLTELFQFLGDTALVLEDR